MSFFDSISSESYDRTYSDRLLASRILSYLRPHAKRLGFIAVLVAIASVARAALPVVLGRGVDLIKANPTTSMILIVPLIIMASAIIAWLSSYGQRRLIVRVVADMLVSLASDAFRSTVGHDLSFYDEYSTGKIQSRITSDTQEFGQLFMISSDLVADVVSSIILGVVLVQTEWKLALVTFGIIPMVFIMTYAYRTLARKVTRQGMRAMANVNSTIKETVSGIAIAKNFRQEKTIYGDFDSANQLSYRVNVRRGLVLSVIFPTLNVIGGLFSAILIYTGGLSVEQGIVTAGAWYLFLLGLDRFMYPVMDLSSYWTNVQSGLSAAERVFALIDAEAAVVQKDNRPVPVLKGQIDFNHVCFRYNDKEQVLEDFDLHIRPGETLALVGHTGAGKSSIARLIARFYEFQEGEIRVDGEDIRSFDLGPYRKQLGIVSQSPFLFSESVINNVRYARPEATEEEIVDLAKQIGEGEWLDTLPLGLKTEVGERGGRLSMGQRQMVSLMRVLVQRPSIFILDEATASIDPFTEWQIQQALNLILKRSTSILIAHRLSTVKAADRIIVMQKGRIIQEGSHDELLARGGHYAELYNTYFRHQSLAYVEESRKLAEAQGGK
jgi:ATP-binding cassette, subfamily B, bacterial